MCRRISILWRRRRRRRRTAGCRMTLCVLSLECFHSLLICYHSLLPARPSPLTWYSVLFSIQTHSNELPIVIIGSGWLTISWIFAWRKCLVLTSIHLVICMNYYPTRWHEWPMFHLCPFELYWVTCLVLGKHNYIFVLDYTLGKKIIKFWMSVSMVAWNYVI